jgi:glucose/arabinose dehydrogenase
LCSFLLGAGRAQAQPAPFQHELLIEGFGLPSSGAFLPDGRMLITTLQGTIHITTPMDQRPVTATVYLQLQNVNNSGEHGLMEILVDPGFATNNYLYVYYSTQQNRNRVSRFVHTGNTALLASETVIFETSAPFNSCCHIGGGMAFANDGHILLAVGDDFTPALAQNLSSPYGKVHRFSSTGATPTDNPYFDNTPGPLNANGVLKTIYASGLRNPFRASYHAATGTFLIGEVGGNDHNIAWEDLHVGAPAANYGWPFCGDGGRTPSGACLDPLYSDPVFTYPHAGAGASITAGFTYTGSMFPEAWQGRYLYGDYARGSIRYLTFDANGTVTGDQPFLDAQVGGVYPLSPVKLLQGPDGALYYIDLVSEQVTYTGAVHRIFYSANQSPTCGTVQATPADGPGPMLTTTLSATAVDAENDPLTYTWTFGDGTPEGTGATVQHTYSTPGTFFPQVVVSDGNSSINCGTVEIYIGTPPTAQILSPGTGSLFRGGEVITFEGAGTDDDALSEASYSWSVVFNHDQHIHPETGATGTSSFDLIIPTTGHGYTGNTYYTITLTVTDQDGLQASTSVQIYPEKVNVTITSTPPGLEVLVEGLPVLTPYLVDQAIGYEMQLALANGQQCKAGNGYSFDAWSDGLPLIHGYVVPANNASVNAAFVPNGPCGSCGQFLSFDGVDDEVRFSPFTLSGNWTIEFWQRPLPGLSAADAILGNDTDLSLDLEGGRLRLYRSGTRITSSVVVNANQWNHYAVVRNGSALSIYVNGVLDAAASSVPYSGNLTVKYLGRGFFSGRYAGGMDELRIWNVARSGAQILAAHTNSIDPGSPGLQGYWRFDQEAGEQVAQDLGPNTIQGINGGSLFPEAADPAFSATNGPLQYACERVVSLALRALLQGPYRSADQLMTDQLRTAGLLPTSEPYTAAGFTMLGGSGSTRNPGVFAVSGPNAVVDWVLIELRDPNTPATILHTAVGLIQRDGDIVGMDGVSPVTVTVNRPTYQVALRHRNHLGVMSASALAFNTGTVTLDLSLVPTATFGTEAQAFQDGRMMLWAGDTARDGAVRYAGANNDRDPILVSIGGTIPTSVVGGYLMTDVDLDGFVKYAGAGNDRDKVLVTIGGLLPTAQRAAQLP